MNIKSLLIGAAAGLVALSGAYAKDVSGEPPGVNVAYVAEMVVPTLSVDTHVSILDTVVSVPTSDPAVSVQGAEPQASVVAADDVATELIVESNESMNTAGGASYNDVFGGSQNFTILAAALWPTPDQKGDRQLVFVDRSTETGI